MQRLLYAVDLHDDPEMIAAYEAWHRADKIWPAVVESFRTAGITALELYRTGDRLVLLIEAPDDFSPADRAKSDAANADVQAWERLMGTFQRPLPGAAPGEKWVPLKRIFSLEDLAG
jgi:L-rhamnose mutarotase